MFDGQAAEYIHVVQGSHWARLGVGLSLRHVLGSGWCVSDSVLSIGLDASSVSGSDASLVSGSELGSGLELSLGMQPDTFCPVSGSDDARSNACKNGPQPRSPPSPGHHHHGCDTLAVHAITSRLWLEVAVHALSRSHAITLRLWLAMRRVRWPRHGHRKRCEHHSDSSSGLAALASAGSAGAGRAAGATDALRCQGHLWRCWSSPPAEPSPRARAHPGRAGWRVKGAG